MTAYKIHFQVDVTVKEGRPHPNDQGRGGFCVTVEAGSEREAIGVVARQIQYQVGFERYATECRAAMDDLARGMASPLPSPKCMTPKRRKKT